MLERCPIPKNHLDTRWLWHSRLEYAAACCLAAVQPSHPLPAAQQDQQARAQKVEEFLDRYGNSLLRFAYSYVHNLSDAEEMVQDTLLQYFKTSPVLETKQHEKAWLMRVCANLCKNRLDYNARRQADQLSDLLAAEPQQDLSFVWEAVKALPQKYREVLHLFHYEGYPTSHIAQLLGKKESTVRSLLLRGRTKLKQVLKEGYDFEEI